MTRVGVIPAGGIAIEHCRFCGSVLSELVADLGSMPPSNSYTDADRLDVPDPCYPLNVYRCSSCSLVQVGYLLPPATIFGRYAYYSSYSRSWVEHARIYTESMISRLNLQEDSLVVEVGSNDGYLLRHFVPRSIPVLGIDPASNVIEVARANGVPTLGAFLDEDLAADLVDQGKQADLLIGNNVFAHVPDINSFTKGLSLLLKADGVLTLEFPHLLRLLQETQFDTIYHEHYAYYSLLAAESILSAHGLKLFDVEELTTHGGSLRLFACRKESNRFDESAAVQALRTTELRAGLDRPDVYARFSERLPLIKQEFNEFVAEARRDSKRIAGYSAPAKGNTFLNYCGLTAEDITFVTDLNPEKQNHLLPGSRIPIRPPQELYEFKPDYVLILAWNLKKEISKQLRDIAEWGGRFVTGIPHVEIFDAGTQEPVTV